MKIGIIGLGERMGNMLNAFRVEEPSLEIAGIVDSDPAKASLRLPEADRSNVRFFESLMELVKSSKPDALAIGTRCDTHSRFAIQAAKYNLPIYLEKPVATSTADAIRLENTFKRSHCPVLASFPLRASILCQSARRLIDGHAIGNVEHLAATNYVPYGDVYFSSWYRDYSVTQGLFLQKATHDFDYLAYLAGSPIVRVGAMLSKGRVYRDSKTRRNTPEPFAYYLEEIGTPETGMNEDSSNALLEFGNGATGIYTQVFFSRRDAAKRGAIISGFDGTIDFDWYKNELKCIHHHKPVTDITKGEEGFSHFGGDSRLAANFIAMIREKADPIATITDGLQSVHACLAARKSAETGRFVSVRQIG